jgi:hypothetical protein
VGFTSPNLHARVLGTKNIISKQLTTMLEKRLNRNHTKLLTPAFIIQGTAKDGQALQAFYSNSEPDPCTC